MIEADKTVPKHAVRARHVDAAALVARAVVRDHAILDQPRREIHAAAETCALVIVRRPVAADDAITQRAAVHGHAAVVAVAVAAALVVADDAVLDDALRENDRRTRIHVVVDVAVAQGKPVQHHIVVVQLQDAALIAVRSSSRLGERAVRGTVHALDRDRTRNCRVRIVHEIGAVLQKDRRPVRCNCQSLLQRRVRIRRQTVARFVIAVLSVDIERAARTRLGRHLALIERLRHRAECTHNRGTRRGELTELAHKRPLSLRIMKSREVISFTNVSIAELATMRQAPKRTSLIPDFQG